MPLLAAIAAFFLIFLIHGLLEWFLSIWKYIVGVLGFGFVLSLPEHYLLLSQTFSFLPPMVDNEIPLEGWGMVVVAVGIIGGIMSLPSIAIKTASNAVSGKS